MSSARIISRSPSETTAEQEARARAWAYVLDCYRKKEAYPPRRLRGRKGDQE